MTACGEFLILKKLLIILQTAQPPQQLLQKLPILLRQQHQLPPLQLPLLYPPVIPLELGDINGDGLIDAVDATAVSIEYAHLATGGESTLTDEQKKVADVNGDGFVDAVDSTIISMYYAKVSAGENITFAEFVENNK